MLLFIVHTVCPQCSLYNLLCTCSSQVTPASCDYYVLEASSLLAINVCYAVIQIRWLSWQYGVRTLQGVKEKHLFLRLLSIYL